MLNWLSEAFRLWNVKKIGQSRDESTDTLQEVERGGHRARIQSLTCLESWATLWLQTMCILKINPLFLKVPYSLESEDTNTKLRDLVQWKKKIVVSSTWVFCGEGGGWVGCVWKRGRNGDMNLPFLLLAHIMKKSTSDGKSWAINHHIIWMFLFNKYPCLSCSLYPTLYFSHDLLIVRVSWVYKEIKHTLQRSITA